MCLLNLKAEIDVVHPRIHPINPHRVSTTTLEPSKSYHIQDWLRFLAKSFEIIAWFQLKESI